MNYRLNDPASPNYVADLTERLSVYSQVFALATSLGVSVDDFLKSLVA